jgi:hypothetical protein
MSSGSHPLASWLLANAMGFEHRERRIVALAGLAPDLDGLGYLIDRYNEFVGVDSFYYQQFHHVIGHNLLASAAIATCAALIAARRRAVVFAASMLADHLHFLCFCVMYLDRKDLTGISGQSHTCLRFQIRTNGRGPVSGN